MEKKRVPRKKGQPAKSKKHSDLYTDEDPKGTIHGLGFKDVATARASVAKIRKSNRSHAHKTQAAIAMEQRARAAGKTSEAAVFRKFIEQQKKKTKAKKNEDLTLEEIILEELDNVLTEKCWPGYEKKGMKTMFGKRYPNCVKKSKKKKKNEEIEEGKQCALNEEGKECPVHGKKACPVEEYDISELQQMDEEGLRDWFGKSKSKDGKKGWVQVVSGKPCARQPGQKTTPKCVSSAKRASMSKKERESAQRRKRAADPNQPKKSGAAKPTYVSTDKKKKKKVKKEAKANWYEPHM